MDVRQALSNITINLKPWLFGLNTLIFFPFMALIFWCLGIHSMDRAGYLGLFFSILLSAVFFRTPDFQLTVNQRSHLAGILIFSAILTVLYYFRLNFEFVDIHCPTNLLGFVSQLRRGHFPVSFLAFPEFPANYHAGFPLIAGYMSRWFGLDEYFALRLLSIGLFFFVALGVQLFFLSLCQSWKVIAGVLLFFFSFSFPARYFFPDVAIPEWLKDTSLFDYFRSNSWPLTYLTLLLMLFYFWKSRFTTNNMMVFALYVLLLSILNATVHSLFLITVVLTVIYEVLFIPSSRKRLLENHFLKAIFLMGLLLVVRKLTYVIPSAFMMGSYYREVEVGWRFLLKDYGVEMKGYFFQCGLLPWLSFCVALLLLIQRGGTVLIRGMAIFFIAAFLFPVIFYLKGITSWDNYHKFFLTSYFFGSILVFISWSKAKGYHALFLTVGIALTLFLSAPNAWKMVENETSWQPVPAYAPDNNDIIQFLKGQPAGTQLVPYAKEGYFFCSVYTEIAAASGLFTKDGYCFWFFTLSGPVETDFIRRQDWWKTKSGFQKTLKQITDRDYFIIVKREFIQDFDKVLRLPDIKRIEFKKFILLHRKASKRILNE